MTEENLSYEDVARLYNAESKIESNAKTKKKKWRDHLMSFLKKMSISAGEDLKLAEDVVIGYTIPKSEGTIQRDLLLAEGVSMETILKCTKKPESEGERIYVKVKAPASQTSNSDTNDNNSVR